MLDSYTLSAEAEMKQISPTAHFMLPGTLAFSDEPHEGWQINVDIDLRNGQISPTSVQVVASDTQSVTGGDLRAVAIHLLLGKSLLHDKLREFWGVDKGWLKSQETVQRIRAEGPTDENVRYAAELFLFSKATRGAASEFVQHSLGLPKPTAARWLRRARELGYIDGDD